MIKCGITGSKGVLGRRIIKNLPYRFYEFKKDITKKKNININFCGFDLIILSSELVGKNPPKEIKLILKFKELNILIPEIFKNKKITKLDTEYKIKILNNKSFMLDSELILPSPE